jgi:hypothetical protein
VELVSYTVWGRDWFPPGWEGLRDFLCGCGLSGLELLGAGTGDRAARPPNDLVTGLHLKTPSEPTVREAAEALSRQFRVACDLEADYAVVHLNSLPVGAALPASRWPEDRAARERLHATVAWSWSGGPFLALENSFGPGARLADLDALRGFFDGLEREGIDARLVLDFGHHLLALALAGQWEGAVPCEEAALEAGIALAHTLRQAGIDVSVLHLHWPGAIPPPLGLVEQASAAYGAAATEEERSGVVDRLFESVDRHQPLSLPAVASLVAELAPEYVVHEVAAMSPAELASMLDTQRGAMRGGWA